MAKPKRDVHEVPAGAYRFVSNSELGTRLTGEMMAELSEGDDEAAGHGIVCLEYKVLVLPRKAEERTKGGIVLPEQVVEKDQHAAMEGTIAGMSPFAFTYEEWPIAARKPRIGDVVVFARYSGITQKGADGRDYRIMNDKDIVAVRRATA